MTYLTWAWHFHWSSSCETPPRTAAAPRRWSAIPPLRPPSSCTLRGNRNNTTALCTARPQHDSMRVITLHQNVFKPFCSFHNVCGHLCSQTNPRERSANLKLITKQSAAQWCVAADCLDKGSWSQSADQDSWSCVSVGSNTCRPSRAKS